MFYHLGQSITELPGGKGFQGAYVGDGQPGVIESLIGSGYGCIESSLYGLGDPVPCVSDTFYGSKWGIGLIPIEKLQDYLCTGEYHPFAVPEYQVRSLAEAEDALACHRHDRFRKRMCFRGQVREYFTTREFPNPHMKLADGHERLIIPSIWRQFADDWCSRLDFNPPPSLFSTIYGDEIIYYGIPDWRNLARRNMERYGVHTMSDLEDFPDPDSQDYGRRWSCCDIKCKVGSHSEISENMWMGMRL